MVQQAFNSSPEATKQFLQEALECVQDPSLVVVYNLQDSGPDDFSNCILQAVFHSGRTLLNKLKQAMFFDRIDFARNALLEASESEIKQCINDNLMAALLHNKPEFVSLYLSYDAKIYQLRPTGKTNSDIEWKKLPPFALAIKELYKKEAERKYGHIRQLAEASLISAGDTQSRRPLERLVTKTPVEDLYSVSRMEKILSRLVSSDFEVQRDFAYYKPEYDGVPDIEAKRESQATHMLFLWAVCLDKFRMARMFWQRSDQSIINALVASRILERLSTHRALAGPHLAEEREKMKYNSKKFETLAVGVLQECHNSDSNLTAEMLHVKNSMFNKKNAINIAYDANSLAFLSHPAVQSVINTDWYGKLKTVTSFWKVLLAYFFPFFVLPFIRFQDDDHVEEKAPVSFDFFPDIDPITWAIETPRLVARLRRKFAKFYSAPFTRFISDLLSHLTLCMLTSYYVLDTIDNELSAIETLLVVWFCTLVLEELRQMIFGKGILDYLSDMWNRLDLIMISIYFTGFFIRISDIESYERQTAAKATHAFLVIVLWLRFLRYYALSNNLGPKLIMMLEMIKDVTTFVFLLFIFLVGYGVASQSLLSPDVPFSSGTIANVLYRPYFQIYGELFLDDLTDESQCASTSYPFSDCEREEVSILPFFLAFYVLGTNVLLVNLLIAMFNDTYIKVQEAAGAIWRKQNYELFQEYKERPFLPAPFIVITHIYLILQACRRCVFKSHDSQDEEKKKKMDELYQRVSIFEEMNSERFLRRSEQEERETLEERVKATSERVEQVSSLMTVMLEHMVSFRTSIDRQLMSLRREITDHGAEPNEHAPYSTSSLEEGTMRSLGRMYSTQVVVQGNGQPAADASADDPVLPADYPKSNGVKRFSVDRQLVPWATPLPGYQPVEYTDPTIIGQVWADEEDPSGIRFGQKDLINGKVVDRTTCHPVGIKLDPETKRPINPWGRTGLTGRGLLGKWGVNQAADTVVTRWKRAADGSILERDGRKVLEFVAIQRIDNGMWAIPGGFVDNGEDIATTNGREFIEEALGIKEQNGRLSKEEEDAVNNLFSSGELVGRIYSSDPRNTDNAWVETFCVNFHDESGRYASRLRLQGGDDATHARWMMVHGGLNLFASHNKLIKLVTELHGAYY
eukprot:m.125316 g.125316  ORF g.125316 m.125316 type:complete len:1141 (-) comp15614_c1_seq5:98-3520(-)